MEMSFAWPGMLWLLLCLPVLAGFFWLSARRRHGNAARSGGILLIAAAATHGARVRRLIPPALFLLGVGISVLALTRPSASVLTVARRGTVILSLDVSGSMRAKDIFPTRMDAVKEAAKLFVNSEPPGVLVGVVAFSGTANLVQAPTGDRSQVLSSIDRLRPQMFTAIGSGLQVAMEAIFPRQEGDTAESPDAPLAPLPQTGEPPSVAPGSYHAAMIVLLSDGQNNQGPDPLDVAERVANRGVQVYTVGVGTQEGAMVGFQGFTFHAILDEATLKRIAAMTGGSYFKASNADELRGIYGRLGSRLMREKEPMELTAPLAGLAVALFLVMGALSLLWFNRVL